MLDCARKTQRQFMRPARGVGTAIPAFQAENTISEVVRRTKAVVGEVLVIDDGSDDGTARAASDAGAFVLRQPHNLGKGRALRTAFRELFRRGAISVVTLDADGQHCPEEIPKLIKAAERGADLVIGSRDHVFAQMHPVRRVSNRWSSKVISMVAGSSLKDVQSGFRLYTRRLLEQTGFEEMRFEAESAVVVRAVRMGFKVACVPVQLGYPDGRRTSHYRPIVDSLRIARAVARARLESLEAVIASEFR